MREDHWLLTERGKVLQRDVTGKHHYVVFKELEIGLNFLNPGINRIKSKLSHSNHV